jgi:hypothetical protein
MFKKFAFATVAGAIVIAAPIAGKVEAQPGTPIPKSQLDANNARMAQTLAQPLAPNVYQWTAGEPPVLMDPVSTHICLLTGVAGDFAGGGERVILGIDQQAAGGPRWGLAGTSGQGPEVRATATCVAKTKFVPAVLNPSFLTETRHPMVQHGACGPQNTRTNRAVATNAHFIAEMGGKFRGGGEVVAVGRQGTSGTTLLRACSGYVRGGAVSINTNFLGRPALYQTRTARTGNLGAATFVYNQQNADSSFLDGVLGAGPPFISGESSIRLVPVNSAICGFVSIAGRFQGLGEALDIVAVNGPGGVRYWQLNVSNPSAGGYIAAAVRCYARDQRP